MFVPKFAVIAVLLLAALCLPYPSHAAYEKLLNKPYAERYEAIDTLFYSPKFWQQDKQVAISQIAELEKTAKQAGDEELVLEARFVKASYIYNTGAGSRQQYLDDLQQLLEIANKKEILQLRIRLYFVMSVQHFTNDAFGPAFEYEIKYYELLKSVTPEAFPWKKLCIAHIGGVYYSFEDYDNALKFLQEANSLKGSYKVSDDINVLNTLGLVMRNTGRYDSALYYFEKALALTTHERNWRSVVTGNMGITYYFKKDYERAIPLLKDDIEQGREHRDFEGITNSVIRLADIYRMKGLRDSALHYAIFARQCIAATVWHPYQHLVQLYTVFKKLAEQRGDQAMALRYADSIVVAKDSLFNRRSVLLLASARHKVEKQRHRDELDNILTERKLGIYKRNALIGLLVAVVAFFLLAYNRQLILRKKLIAEKRLADADLKNAAQQLDIFTNSLHEKNDLIEKFSAEIERLQALPCSNELPDTFDNLAHLRERTILTEEQWNDFRGIFEKVHSGYFDRLKAKLPDFTPAEVRIMVLTKLRMSNKEMANILGIDAGTIRYHKYNLRKKTGDMAETIEELAESI